MAEQFDLPRPNLAVEDSYGGGGMKKPATGMKTTSEKSQRPRTSSLAMTGASESNGALCETVREVRK